MPQSSVKRQPQKEQIIKDYLQNSNMDMAEIQAQLMAHYLGDLLQNLMSWKTTKFVIILKI